MFQILILACLVLKVTSDGDLPDLKWPDKYAVNVEKLILTSGRVQNMQVWFSKKKSRVDYNNGAVKSIVKKSLRRAKSYFIHPETDYDDKVEIVCTKTQSRRIDVEAVVPSIEEDFVISGNENVRGKECYKVTSKEDDESTDSRKTFWIMFDNTTKSWEPVRYELIEFLTWTGRLDKHEIWDFHNFNTDFNENVFTITNDYCNNTEIYSLHDDVVTKHLMFMDSEKDHHVDHVFNAFKQKYAVNYDDDAEHNYRRKIFKRNMRLIISTNLQNLGYKLAVNKFADKTPEEMVKYKGLRRRKTGEKGTIPFPYKKHELQEGAGLLPTDYDLRLLGVISPVKNQGECGSCWTFGTTSAVEGALARKNGGRLIRLSNQALIDCAWAFDAAGCDGGSDTAAYHWMLEYGLPTESEYGPYANQDGVCKIENMTQLYPIRGFTDVTPYNVDALKLSLVNHGPLSVSINAIDSLSLYDSGIFYDPECKPSPLNHEVSLVGYAQRDGEDYWVIKNSWGVNWGVDGYLYISTKDNNCGVMSEPTYVVL